MACPKLSDVKNSAANTTGIAGRVFLGLSGLTWLGTTVNSTG